MAFQITIETMVMFFALLALGFGAGKLKILKAEFLGQLSMLITKIFLPVLIFYSTTTTVTLDLIKENIILFPLSVVIYAALALCAFAVAKAMRIEHDKDRIFQFSFIFGNTGFVGFPLLSTVFPGTGIVFMCLFTVVDQLAFWTYGIWLSTARDRQAAGFNAKMLLSPNIIAIVLAFIFVLLGINLPNLLNNILGSITRATTPLCMIFLGGMICFNKVGETLKRPDAYVQIIVKMVLLPICAGTIAGAVALPADIVGCTAFYVALPVMTVVPMISAQNGNEGAYATGIAVMTFVACVVTIPIVAFLVL